MRGHGDYFAALDELLRNHGAGVPKLVVDLERVDRNVARLLKLQTAASMRIVAKSLPCPDLLAHVFAQTGYEKLMVFHLPFLLQIVERFPKADVLMGKPLPDAAVRRFYRERSANAFDDCKQLQWLVDTDARLRQIAQLARDIRKRLRVNIELDVGMHRGGLADIEQLKTMLDTLRDFSDDVQLAGFMGYDAHVPKAPWPHSVEKAASRAKRRYAEFLEFAWSGYSDLEESRWCINGAGSPTIAMHGEDSPLNDLSVGSVLVKPTNFDLPTLEDFEPAVWIASPVLKRSSGVRIPFVEALPSRRRDTLFIYGGKWMAQPWSPEGLRENPTYGLSSNQQMLTVPTNTDIDVDDYVFLWPAQSEALLLQFGDLFVVRDNTHVDDWPVFR